MKAVRHPIAASARWSVPLLAFTLAGCRSPTVDLLGSYFPAWLICIVIGIVLTVIARLIFIALRLHGRLYPAPIVYLCLFVIFTFVTWLAYFQD